MLKSFIARVGHSSFTYTMQSMYYNYEGYSTGVAIFMTILHAGWVPEVVLVLVEVVVALVLVVITKGSSSSSSSSSRRRSSREESLAVLSHTV